MKKAFKQTVAFCLAVIMLISLTTVLSFATSGSCGENLTWEIDNGKLTISGSGAMEDYTEANEAPWFEQRFTITEVVIGDNVTTVGDYAFSGLENLVTADCGNVEFIGNFAFLCCITLDSVTLGDNLRIIGEGAFANCSVLSQVEIPDAVEAIDTGAFMGTAIEGNLVFGDKLKSIGTMAFYMCYGITGVTIPDSVVAIGDAAFLSCEFINSVSLGKNVAYIGELAFAHCTDLKEITISNNNANYKVVDNALLTKNGEILIAYAIDTVGAITIPSTVKEIGAAAFSGSYSITSVTLPEGLEIIGDGAFADCWFLESVNLPASLTIIGDMAFASDFCITELTIPKNVKEIGAGAFCDMSAIANFNIESGNTNYSISNGVLFNSDKTELVACPSGKTGSYSVPNTVKDIYAYAFSGCSELKVTLPNGVESIGDYAFRYCYDMSSMTIPESVKSIGENVFASCGFIDINVANANTAYTSIDGVLFTDDMTTLIYYPAEKTRESYNVPNGVIHIANNAFDYANIYSITIPNSVETIGDYAFNFCDNLITVNIGNGVRTIGKYAFSDCHDIVGIELPRNLEYIGAYAFAWCDNLDTVIVNGQTYMDICAFAWCSELDDVEFKSAAPNDIGDMVFYGCSDVFKITYVNGTADWTTPTWMGYNTSDNGTANITPGDINGDGRLSNSDLVRLARYLIGIGEIDEAAGDINGDGRVSNADLVQLARLLISE